MNEFWDYIVYKFLKLLRRQSILNFQVFYFLSFVIVAYGGYRSENFTVLSGFIIFILTAIYHDYKSGGWKGEQRKEMGRLLHRDLKPLKALKKQQIPVSNEEEKKKEITDGERQQQQQTA